VVVDDGLPEHWFSRKYPETAKHCKVIDLEQHDVGVGIGRNTAIDAAETEFIFLLDDDQIVTPVHDHVAAKPYGALRARPKFRRLGLRKHGFDSLRYPGGGIVHA